jgi:membrane dipeptidase
MTSSLHADSIVIDGLVISRWDRALFEEMRAGGVTAANCTCCIWENFRDTMLNIAAWHRRFDDFSDVIMPVKTTADIQAAKKAGKVGIILGFQNTSAIEDRLDTLTLFKKLGVGIIQLTYNTQNLIGSGVWEENDGGLSGFGREAVSEMNRVGIAVDLSHVGKQTADDAIKYSKLPCTYSHVCPAGLFAHPRNKTDEQLRTIVERGGFVGITPHTPFMVNGVNSTLDDCIDLFEYTMKVCGEDNVGIGSDFTQNQDEAFFNWVRKDKGYARQMVVRHGVTPPIKEFSKLSDYERLTTTMVRRGWSESRIRGVLGENWLGYLAKVIDRS